MLTNRVVFSFFRYRGSHALSSLLLMAIRTFVADKDVPSGALRLMGCGSGDGFSIVPDPNRYCLMSSVAGPDDLTRLRKNKLYRRVAGPSVEQLHFVLRPATGHGTWDGKALFDYSSHRVGSRPFAVLTRARVAPARAPAFWRRAPEVRRSLRDAPGCAYHVGFGEHPLLTLATFSVWRDLESMQAFAYRHNAHHQVAKESRADSWLTESLFVRFEIESIEGDVERHPKLHALGADAGIGVGEGELLPPAACG
jgi:hypothetical protein